MLSRGLSSIGLNGTSPWQSPRNLWLQNRWVIRCSLPSLAMFESEDAANFCNASCAFSLASSSSSTDKLHKYQGRQSQKLVFTWWGQGEISIPQKKMSVSQSLSLVWTGPGVWRSLVCFHCLWSDQSGLRV